MRRGRRERERPSACVKSRFFATVKEQPNLYKIQHNSTTANDTHEEKTRMHSVARQLAIRVATSYSSSSSSYSSSYSSSSSKTLKVFSNSKIFGKRAMLMKFTTTTPRASSDSSSSKNENDNTDESKPQNELIEALDKISKRENLVKKNKRKQPDVIVENAAQPPPGGSAASLGGGGGSNTVMGPGTSEEWRELDEKVNTYPSERKFQAIGVNSPEFVGDMVKLVEDTLGDGRKVHPENVTSNLSKNGKYCSANMTVVLMNGEEVINIMAKLKADERVKWYL
jgi:putative lipoic acid-binding regulatory protein